MNEKRMSFFKNRYLLLIIGVILLWALGATAVSIHCRREYKSALDAIEAAGGSEFAGLVEQHNDTALGVQDDIGAVRTALQSAVGRAGELEQSIERAFGLAQQSDVEFIEFGNTMAGAGGTIKDLIERQQRINEIVGRIEANHRAIKVELGVRP